MDCVQRSGEDCETGLALGFADCPAFPFLTSWVLFLNWSGGLWSDHAERMQRTHIFEADTARACIFLALAITTAVFLKVGPRLVRIGLLAVITSILIVITALSLPVDLGFVAVGLMILASVAFLLSPAVLEAQANRRNRLGVAGQSDDNQYQGTPSP